MPERPVQREKDQNIVAEVVAEIENNHKKGDRADKRNALADRSRSFRSGDQREEKSESRNGKHQADPVQHDCSPERCS